MTGREVKVRLLVVAVALAERRVTRRQAAVAAQLARWGRGSHYMAVSWNALREAEAWRDVLVAALARVRGS